MIDNSIISVFFIMFMVVLVLMALISPGFIKKKDQINGDNTYFWPLLSLASLFGVAALVLVLIK